MDTQRAKGALVHGFRHTFATELANANVSVYALMKLLGRESMIYLSASRSWGRHPPTTVMPLPKVRYTD
jgi:integrase